MKTKRIIALLLAVLMTVSCMSFSTLTVGAADTTRNATIKVESETAVAGSTVTLDITIQDNPGILGMTLVVNYDESAAKLIAVENGDSLPGMTFTTPMKLSTGCKLPWDAESVKPEDIQDGTIARLTFEVLPTVANGSSIAVELTHDPGAIIDNDMHPLTVNIENGTIHVMDYTPGDLNDDGIINTTDVVRLRRYIAGGYGISINEAAGDVNADGILNTTDVVKIRRFVAGGYGVELLPGKHTHTEAIDAAKAPTCTETGLTEGKHCASCGEVLVKQEIVPATGHTYGDDNVCDNCGHTQTAGKLIYAEHFDRVNSADTEAVLNAIGWDQLTVLEDGSPHQTNAAFEIRDGKLYYTNYADGIDGKDGYYEIASLSGEFMKDVFRNTYTLQYDIYYTDASDVNRYVNFITDYTPGAKYYNTAHFRIGGYGNNQCRYEGAWLNYEAEDEYNLSAELKNDANENGYTTICKKLLGVDYDGKTYFFKDMVVTVRVVYDADKGPELYLKTENMTEFVQVSRYSDVSEVAEQGVWKTWEGTSVLFKIGAKINGWVDNVYLWEGSGDVPAEHNHTWSDWSVTSAAGCLNKGVEQRSCSCGLVDSRLSNATGHDFENGKTCRICSAVKYSEGLSYTLKADNTYTVSLGTCTDTEIVIPAMLPNGRIITEIAASAFLNCENITDISVPDTVEKIGTNAFAKCTNLTYYADDYGYYLGNEQNPFLILIDVKDTKLTSFDFRPTTKIIGEKAFFQCKNLTAIEIPEGVTQIVRYSFQSCNSLKAVSIPASVKYIDFWTFYQSANIESLTVSAQNPIYQSINNCIVEKATKTLITGVESSVIPTGGEYVTVLGNNAFCRVTWNFANIPDGITEISQLVFQSCAQLESVCIADSVTVIGKNVFKGCENLQTIYYTGTVADWAKISIDATNAELNAATIVYYSETKPTENGNYWHYVDGVPTLWERSTLPVDPSVEAGIIIFEEHFDYANDNDTASVLNTIGWTKLTKEKDGVYNETDAEFAIIDGRLYYDNWDAEGLPEGDTRVRGADGYYQIDMLNQEYMEQYVAGKYTLQYELEYVDSKNISRYAMLITECSADGECYNSFMPRIGGYGNYQCHYQGSWKTYDKFDPATDMYAASTATDADSAATKGTPICYKLLGKYYDKNEPHMLANMKITIRLQWEPGAGHHVYMKVGDMQEFVEVSYPHPDGDGLKHIDKWEGYAVRFKLGAAIDGYIDNIMMWTGWGEKPDPHTIHEWTMVQEPTCVATGKKQGTCVDCGQIVTQIVERIPHNYTDNICTICGGVKYSEGLTYSLSSGATSYTVTGIGTCTDTVIVIPGVYKGVPVTAIANSAFEGNKNITSVELLNGITSIGEFAFSGCSKLTEMILCDSLISIGEQALPTTLRGTTAYQNGIYLGSQNNPYLLLMDMEDTDVSVFNIHKDTKLIGDHALQDAVNVTSIVLPSGVLGIGRHAFGGCRSLVSVDIPYGLTAIRPYAFNNCVSLASIDLPDSIEVIEYNAFYNCSSLTALALPAKLSTINVEIIGGCSLLNSLTMDEGSTKYYAVNNCIIETSTKTLVLGCSSSVIPDDGSVTVIGSYAFAGARGLVDLNLPSCITAIKGYAFKECTGLSSVVIPANVSSIARTSFSGCKNLMTITVDSDNSTYYSVGNCLIERTTGVLVEGCTGSVIPNDGTITAIEAWAFDASAITEVVIPDGITNIAQCTFQSCNKLQSITIPASVTTIARSAFWGCSQLKTVYYAGTEEQWKAISIAERNDYLTQATIVFSNPSQSFEYTELADGTLAVSGIGTITATDIVIPSEVGGKAVTKIADKAFQKKSTITSVVISNGITEIGANAFMDCKGLKSVSIPESVTAIGKNPFMRCTSLNTITVADNNAVYSDVGNGLIDIANKTLIAVTTTTQIPADGSVTVIGSSAYNSMTKLTELIIPEGVTEIAYSALYNCTGLTTLHIPASVTDIERTALWDVSNLITITVAEGNPRYCVIDGSLVDKNTKALIVGTASTKIPAGGSVTSIADFAFCGRDDITSMVIPEGITEIGFRTFESCTGLTTIEIPASVQSIDNNAFNKCSALTTVNYGGTAEQWAKISIGSNNSWLTDANIIYNYIPATHSIGLEYELSADGSYYTVTGIGTCTDNTLVIPGKYNGIAVTTIGEDAFINATQITSVIILEGVKIIGADAFRYCNSLKTITLPDSLVEIKSRAFDSCVSLEKLEIPVGVTNISNTFGIIAGCISLTTLTVNPLNTTFHSENNCVIKTQTKELWMGCSTSVIPSNGSVETLGRYAFSGMNLQNVVIPDAITTILGYAFQNCDLITSMTIPANVSSIKSTLFNRCDNLTSLTVDPGNETYYSVDNCIIEKGTKKLMCVASEFVLPDDGSITTMMGWTFDNQQITELVIPQGMIMIGERAFQNCSKLVEITIPDTVTSIESGAFALCDSLSLVRFTGSEEQWNKIVIAEYNDCLLDATIVFGK